MTEKEKKRELLKRLLESFPEAEYIVIREDHQYFEHRNRIDIVYSVFIDLTLFSKNLHGISAVEAYVDSVIINKVNKES